MRILFPDLLRPKVAAKWLARMSDQTTRSAAQEAVARATGYRDWHELDGAHRGAQSVCDLETAKHVILHIADALDLMPGDAQYAVAKARLLGVSLQIDDHLALTTRIWRERIFGLPARGKPGTIVRVQTHAGSRSAYLSRAGRPSHVVYDTDLGICADFEAVTPRISLDDFVPARLWLPYGYWILGDGSEVIFSRDRFPMWRIVEGAAERINPWLWIEGIREEIIFSPHSMWDSNSARKAALEHLTQRRIFELPRLVHALPYLISSGAATFNESVQFLHQQLGGTVGQPHYARLHPYAS